MRSTLLVDRGIGVGRGLEDLAENCELELELDSVDRVEKPEDVGEAEVEYEDRWKGVDGADGEA